MDGKKCAMEYCDYWNYEEQMCSLALESIKRVEILNMALKNANTKSRDELTELIRKISGTNINRTLQ
jgi:hypothetical protein